jgi:penicillin V acylase-like amidase (Ntn superfamily)
MSLRRQFLAVVLTSLVLGGLNLPAAEACSRVTWLGPEGAVVTGRSMDWPYSFNSHIYVIPQGIAQDGAGGVNSLRWTSRYGAVVTAGTLNPDGAINGAFDGINEKGLAANLLYLGETDFGPLPTDKTPRLSFAAWTTYLLTNFGSVAEVVSALETNPIYIVPVNFGPGGVAHASVHMAISDASGDSAIFEYLGGKLVVHHGRDFQVMTNSPSYDQQLALNAYWARQDRSRILPGSHQSEDRFVRASYYLEKLPQTTDRRQAVAGVFSVMRNISVPWGQADPNHPNLAPTYWRTVIDQSNRVYYFESALSPNIVWVDLKALDFSEGSGIRRVRVEGNDALIGNINANFEPSEPISYLAP